MPIKQRTWTMQQIKDVAAKRQDILDVVENLKEYAVELGDVIPYFEQHKDGRCDFVFVEEGFDSHFDTYVGRPVEWDEHVIGCGLFFDWLKTTYNVDPPGWFRDAMAGKADLPE